jgi:hypothetical protein
VRVANIGSFLAEEFRLVLPPTIYFFCAFNLVSFTTNLMVHHYWFALTNFMFASAMALIVGKVVLVTRRLHFVDRYRDGPLIHSILFKTVFYSVVVALVRMLEVFSHMARDDRGFRAAYDAERDSFTWYHFAAVQLWLFVCFLAYVAAVEITAAVGKERMMRLLFHGRAA